MHPLTLRFPSPALEADFRADYALNSLPQLRAALLAGALFWCMFGPLDSRVADGADLTWLRTMRFGMVLPALLAGVAFTFLPAAARLQQWLVLVVACVVFAGLAGTSAREGIPAEFPRSGLLLAVPLAFAFARLRTPFALAVATFAFVSHEAGFILGRDYRGFDLVYESSFAFASVGGGLVIAYALERSVRTDFLLRQEIAAERARSESLLRNILPEPVADRLKDGPAVIADGFADVTVLFADIVRFTPNSARITPVQLIAILDDVFTRFDELADRYGLEKIKTIGDAYMVVGGIPEPRAGHVEAVAAMALEMRDAIADVEWPGGEQVDLRIGIATGSVVAGVIGRRKFAYDLWGETVNLAGRMESHGLPGAIQVSETVYERLRLSHAFEHRGLIEMKGMGEVRAYILLGRLEGELRSGAAYAEANSR